ncbi:MAG: S1 RNA-binding domain-containing protein, partial [Gammaproteobacteria bacterium]|nr:S1 RNA-binding domain-containing protein [Gammaproteobacteria bacterium]
MSENFAELFEESIASQKIKPGTIIKASVIDVGPDIVLVNAGLKSEAFIPVSQFTNEKGELEVEVGDEVEVALDAVEDGFGETKLSR